MYNLFQVGVFHYSTDVCVGPNRSATHVCLDNSCHFSQVNHHYILEIFVPQKNSGSPYCHCNACHKKWGFTDNELCDCGLLCLHETDEAAVDWLTTYGS